MLAAESARLGGAEAGQR